MGLFSKPSVKSNNHTIIGWLDKADSLITKALQTQNMSGLEQYLTKNVYRQIAEEIRRNGVAYSGINRYKHVTWSNQSAGIYLKKVNYDQIVVSKGMFAKVGDDYCEEWSLTTTDSKTILVSGIRRVSNG